MRIKESSAGQTDASSARRKSSVGSCQLTRLRVPECRIRSSVTLSCINPMLRQSLS